MRKITSIVCCICFALFGKYLANVASDQSPGTGYNTIAAATPTETQAFMPKVFTYDRPITAFDVESGQYDLPDDLVRDIARSKGLSDTVYITKTDTIREQVTKIRWRDGPAPPPVVVRDTIREAHYYIATQVGMKEGPTDECIPVYEVHKVDEICPETNNSSVEPVNELDNDVGE